MSKTITITGAELAAASIAIERHKAELKGRDLADACVRNKRIFKGELEVIWELCDSEILKGFSVKQQELLQKYGAVPREDGSVTLPSTKDLAPYLRDLEEIRTAEIKDEQKRIQEISADWEKREFHLELHAVKRDDLPSDISVEVLESLLPFVE